MAWGVPRTSMVTVVVGASDFCVRSRALVEVFVSTFCWTDSRCWLAVNETVGPVKPQLETVIRSGVGGEPIVAACASAAPSNGRPVSR